nr:hypothetical protein [Salinispora sp. H7-4]
MISHDLDTLVVGGGPKGVAGSPASARRAMAATTPRAGEASDGA